MTDPIYVKIRGRIERRLSGTPHLVTVNALLFTLFTVPFGMVSVLTRTEDNIDGVIYLVILGWSIILLVHTGATYLRSGAWHKTRETFIQQEILDEGDTYALTPEEMIAMHLQLSADLQRNTQPIQRLLRVAIGNVVLWPGFLLVSTIFFNNLEVVHNDNTTHFFTVLLQIALMGTLLLGFLIPVRELWQKTETQTDDLRTIYGYKRKRELSETANQPTDENEDQLVDYGEYEQVQKRS